MKDSISIDEILAMVVMHGTVTFRFHEKGQLNADVMLHPDSGVDGLKHAGALHRYLDDKRSWELSGKATPEPSPVLPGEDLRGTGVSTTPDK